MSWITTETAAFCSMCCANSPRDCDRGLTAK
jgi:hypothetical protein